MSVYVNAFLCAASADIHKTQVRNCDTPVIKREITLPCSPSSLGRAESFGQLTDFYVREHNTQMPHHAFDGQTPDEIYFGQTDGIREQLTAARHQARRERMVANRGESCRACAPPAHQFVSVINAVANAPP